MFNKNSKLNEFRELGLEEVEKQIEDHIGAPILFKTLEEAYEWWYTFSRKFNKIENDAPVGFISISSAYVFYLTKLEGKQRNKLLGVTDDLYEDIKKAKKWFRNISQYVHPDICTDDDPNGMAFIELKKLYDVMIEEDEENENG
jgi:hypothetical protein